MIPQAQFFSKLPFGNLKYYYKMVTGYINNKVEPLYNGHLWGQKNVAVVERWPLWEGRGVIWQKFVWGVQHVYCVKFMLTVYHNVNPITNNIQRDEIHNLNNVLNENVNVTKWTSIVDNLCLLQQYKLMKHNQNTIPWVVINMPYWSIFVTIPDFFISHWKTGCCWEVILPVDDMLY